jgi:RHS repeat-associated protein
VAYYTTAASSAGAGAHFEHQDWLGTERMRTSYNSGNNPAYAVEGTFTSEPWGDAQTVASGTDLDASHYATLDYDAETATDHAQFRQYGDTPGNWMSPDPYYGSYDQSNPQSMNRYAYVLDSPLSNIDPSGLTNCPPYGCTSNPNGGGNGNCLLDGMPVDCSMTGGLVQAGSAYNIPQNIDGGLFAFDQTIYSGRSMYILVNGSDGPVWESVAMGANSIGLGVEILSPEAAAEAGLPDLNNIDDQLIAANNNFDPDDPSYQLAVALGKTGAYSMTSVCFVPAFYAASGTFAAGGVAVANSGEIVSAAAENYPSLIHRAWMWFNNLVGKPPAPVSVITATAATASGISHFCNHH